MLIGIPREVKRGENRVALTPQGVGTLVGAGHAVWVEEAAGVGSGFPDAAYEARGAVIVGREELFDAAPLIVKVKEPLPEELPLFHPGQMLFTFLHLAAEPALTEALLEREVTAIAYETVQTPGGGLPLLLPMSEVAGRMAVQVGARFLEEPQGGRGVLLGGVPGVPAGDVCILGGGIVGSNAARIAVGLGANVTILDIDVARLRYLEDIFAGRITTLHSNTATIAEAVRRADLLIGAVLVPGARAPRLVSEESVQEMKPGAVIVDVAIDQGGSIATCDRVTSHDDPVYVRHGVLHYAVANMPGAVPRTSTYALTNVTLPHIQRLAARGFERAVQEDEGLAHGVNTYRGRITCRAVAEAHHRPYTALTGLV